MFTYIAWVYLLTNELQTVIYTGFTTDLRTRVWEHSTRQNPGSFTARYKVDGLVYYQGFLSVAEAESVEKYIKGKNREWKCKRISDHNPKWRDLTDQVNESFK
jgi:putative endonuclease